MIYCNFGLPLSSSRKFTQLLKVPSTQVWLLLPKQGLERKSSKKAGAEALPRNGLKSPPPLKKGGAMESPDIQS